MTKRLLALALLAQCAVFGQSQLGAGSIGGSVLDPSGHVVTDAAIQVTSEETGLVRRVTSSSAGTFSIPVLPTGRYSLTAEKDGFNKLEQKAIEVSVGRGPFSFRAALTRSSFRAETQRE